MPSSTPSSADPLYQSAAFLLDMDGTVFLSDRLLPGAADFLQTLDLLSKPCLFLTNNSSKDRREYAAKLTRLCLSVSAESIFTSGEATALFLQQEMPEARVYVVGTPSLEAEFRQHGFLLDDETPQAVVLGYDLTLTYAKLTKLCAFARKELPYFATHPDLNCPSDLGPLPDIGATVAYVHASTGRVPDRVFGKPSVEMVAMAARRLGVPSDRLAMIGDRLYTDVAMGNAAGIPAALVLSGETQPADLANSPYHPDYVFNHLGDAANWLRACAEC